MGTAGRLTMTVKGVKSLTKEQLKAGGAIDLVAKQYESFATSEVKTFGGALQQLGNAWGDVFEEIGFIITQSPLLIKIMNVTTKLIGDFLSKTDTSKLTSAMDKIILKGIDLGIMFSALSQPLMATWRVGIIVFNGLKTGVMAAIAVIAKGIEKLASLPFLEDFLPTETLAEFSDFAKEEFFAAIDSTDMALAKLLENNTTFSDGLKSSLESFRSSVTETVKAMNESLEEAGKGTEKVLKKINNTAKETAGAMNQFIGKVATDVFTRFGKALVDGENAFSGFFKSMLGMLGDMAMQMGTIFLLAGTGITSLWGLEGMQAIAAGLGLMALGGVLKALSGGGSESGSSSAAGSSSTDSTGGTTIGQDLLSEDTTETQAEAGPRVTLNVHGDVLDSEESGSRLVAILNEAFEMKGETLITA